MILRSSGRITLSTLGGVALRFRRVVSTAMQKRGRIDTDMTFGGKRKADDYSVNDIGINQ